MGMTQKRNIHLHGAANDLIGAVRELGDLLEAQAQAELARWLQLSTLTLLARIIDAREPAEALERVEASLTAVAGRLGPESAVLRGIAATTAIRRWWCWGRPAAPPRIVWEPLTTEAR